MPHLRDRIRPGDRARRRPVRAGLGTRAPGRRAQQPGRLAHLGPVEEPLGPAHLAGHARAGESPLEPLGLRVDPDQHRHLARRYPGIHPLPGPRRHGRRLRLLVVVLGELGGRPAGPLRDQGRPGQGAPPPVPPGLGQPVRAADHLRCGPVVPHQLHHGGVRVLRRKARQVGGRGAGERVDRLPRVADHAQVVPVPEPRVQQQLLQRVDVLVFVHNEVAVAVAHLGTRALMPAKDRRGQLQHGLEVDQVPVPAQVLIGGEDTADRLGLHRRGPAVAGRSPRVVLRAHLHDLRPLDLGSQVTQFRAARGDPRSAGRLSEQADLRVKHGRRAAADGARPEVDKLAQRRGVEGARHHPVQPGSGRPVQFAQPPAQLARGPRGERDREHVTGVHHAGPDGVGDPVGDRARLSGAGPGDHAHRAAGGQRHLTLLGVERGEYRIRAVVHRAPPSPLSSSRIRPTCGEAQSRARCCISGTTLGEDRRRGCHSE